MCTMYTMCRQIEWKRDGRAYTRILSFQGQTTATIKLHRNSRIEKLRTKIFKINKINLEQKKSNMKRMDLFPHLIKLLMDSIFCDTSFSSFFFLLLLSSLYLLMLSISQQQVINRCGSDSESSRQNRKCLERVSLATYTQPFIQRDSITYGSFEVLYIFNRFICLNASSSSQRGEKKIHLIYFLMEFIFSASSHPFQSLRAYVCVCVCGLLLIINIFN